MIQDALFEKAALPGDVIYRCQDRKLARMSTPVCIASTDPSVGHTVAFSIDGGSAVGAWGAIIMSFFGAVFASLTLYWERQVSGVALALPFVAFASIGLAAGYIIRKPGEGIKPTAREERAIMWSTIGEGVGLFLASNIVINLHRPDLLLPSMALVVGLHFLPIARAARFRPFYVLGAALIVAAVTGFIVGAPTGGEIAGFMAAGALLLAAIIAIRRDWLAKQNAALIA